MRPVQANTIGKGEFPIADPGKQKRMHEVKLHPIWAVHQAAVSTCTAITWDLAVSLAAVHVLLLPFSASMPFTPFPP